MRKTVLTIAGSALIALSTMSFAAAAERHQGRAHHHASVRDSNAYVLPDYDAAQPNWYRYSGGYSAPAGR